MIHTLTIPATYFPALQKAVTESEYDLELHLPVQDEKFLICPIEINESVNGALSALFYLGVKFHINSQNII